MCEICFALGSCVKQKIRIVLNYLVISILPDDSIWSVDKPLVLN